MSGSKPEREKAAATAAKQVTCTAPFAATGIAVDRAPSPAVAPQKAPVLQKPEAIRLQRPEAWKRCPVGGLFDLRCMGARDANVQHLVLQGHHPGCCDPCLMRTKIPRALSTIADLRPNVLGCIISVFCLPWSRLLVTDYYVFQRVARTYAWLTRVATDF